MVKFHTKSNPQGQYYLPKEVRQELGEELDLICDAKAAVVYNSKTPLEQVLRSLDVLRSDLENRVRNQREVAAE
jgi:bifunctional DNA-binding transcriptional regulator/antitoxin component of YhaV-PrlF toxin-antitoxin module